MSNWFQDHPTTGIITYTLMIVGATWATSTFILQDNRLNLVRSELESQKAVAEQYRAKSELLQSDIAALRAENQEYRAWLAQSKDAVPIMVPQLVDLRRQVELLKTKHSVPSEGVPFVSLASSNRSTTAASSPTPKPIPNDFSEVRVAKLGSAAIDDATGVVVTVLRTIPSHKAELILLFPGQKPVTDESAYPGKQYQFAWGERSVTLTLLEINFLTDTVKFRLSADA